MRQNHVLTQRNMSLNLSSKKKWNSEVELRRNDYLSIRSKTNKSSDWTSGWWYTYPCAKYELKSVGMMTFPTEWKIIKFHGSKPTTSSGIFMYCFMVPMNIVHISMGSTVFVICLSWPSLIETAIFMSDLHEEPTSDGSSHDVCHPNNATRFFYGRKLWKITIFNLMGKSTINGHFQ